MTQLRRKNFPDGSKIPQNTPNEMKDAFGKLHDYLASLSGIQKTDRIAARQALNNASTDLPNLATCIKAFNATTRETPIDAGKPALK